jgi:hypothetical protein
LTKHQALGSVWLVLKEPLEPEKARRLIREILEKGSVSFSGHSLEALVDDDLSTVDAVNVLRGGTVEPAEFEKGTWRYRVRTLRMAVVIVFRSASEVVVVTAWREKR